MQNCQLLVCGVFQLSIAITTIQVLSLDWLVITQYCTESMEGWNASGVNAKRFVGQQLECVLVPCFPFHFKSWLQCN